MAPKVLAYRDTIKIVMFGRLLSPQLVQYLQRPERTRTVDSNAMQTIYSNDNRTMPGTDPGEREKEREEVKKSDDRMRSGRYVMCPAGLQRVDGSCSETNTVNGINSRTGYAEDHNLVLWSGERSR